MSDLANEICAECGKRRAHNSHAGEVIECYFEPSGRFWSSPTVWVKMSCANCNQLGVFSSKEAADAANFGFCSYTVEVEIDGDRVGYRDD